MRIPFTTPLVVTALVGCSFVSKFTGSTSSASAAPGRSSSSGGEPRASGASTSGGAASEAETEGCERYITISDEKIEPILMLMRCPDSDITSSNDPLREYAAARSWIRRQLDTSLAEPPQILRAAYAHLCARELSKDDRPPPALAIGCAWQTDRIDNAKLAPELKARGDGGALGAQLAKDIDTVHKLVATAYPKATKAREWEVFYALPNRVLEQAIAYRRANAAAYQQIAAFDAALQGGSFETCAPPLREALATHLRGAKGMAGLTEKATDPLGYALVESLARCHYYNDREAKAAVTLALVDRARRRVSFAEQIYFAQIDALAEDAEKSKKFPNLVGSKYSAVQPSDLRQIDPWTANKLDTQWLQNKHQLPRLSTRDGRVARVEPAKSGATIHFQKERVPLVDVKCHETGRIDSIDRDGKIRYREECTSTSKGMTWSSPQPVTVDEATGVSPGRFVRVAVEANDQGVVAAVTDGPGEDARVSRIADVVLAK